MKVGSAFIQNDGVFQLSDKRWEMRDFGPVACFQTSELPLRSLTTIGVTVSQLELSRWDLEWGHHLPKLLPSYLSTSKKNTDLKIVTMWSTELYSSSMCRFAVFLWISWVFGAWLCKRSHLKMPYWALRNCDEHGFCVAWPLGSTLSGRLKSSSSSDSLPNSLNPTVQTLSASFSVSCSSARQVFNHMAQLSFVIHKD